jgi:hypothetical protein
LVYHPREDRIRAGVFTGPAGTFCQRTELSIEAEPRNAG